MNKPYIYSSGDYAGMVTGGLNFYYGYEQIDTESEEWCFVVNNNGQEVMRIKASILSPLVKGDEPIEFLLAGIAMYLSK